MFINKQSAQGLVSACHWHTIVLLLSCKAIWQIFRWEMILEEKFFLWLSPWLTPRQFYSYFHVICTYILIHTHILGTTNEGKHIIFILLQLAYNACISSGCIHFPTNNTTSFLMAEKIFIVYKYPTAEEWIRIMWYRSWDFCGLRHSKRKHLVSQFLLLPPLLLLLLPLIFPYYLIIHSFVTFINLETGLCHIAQATKKVYAANLQPSPLLSLPPKCWVQAWVPGLGFSSCTSPPSAFLLPVSLLSKDEIMANGEEALEETSWGSSREG